MVESLSVLLTLLTIAGFALVIASLVLHAARTAAEHRESKRRAELIRLRLKEEPVKQRVAYRKIEIRLSGS